MTKIKQGHGKTITAKKTSKRFLAYSAEIRLSFSSTQKKKRLLSNAIRLVFSNLPALRNGCEIEHGEIKIDNEINGKPTKKQTTPLRIRIGLETLFLKIYPAKIRNGPQIMKDYFAITKYLQTIGGKFMDRQIRVIKPHLIYEGPVNREQLVFLVTDFYGKRFVQISNIPKSKEFAIIQQMKKEFGKKGFFDINQNNSFLDTVTNEIILFDITTKK